MGAVCGDELGSVLAEDFTEAESFAMLGYDLLDFLSFENMNEVVRSKKGMRYLFNEVNRERVGKLQVYITGCSL